MTCKVGALLEPGSPLSPDDRASLDAALAAPDVYPATQLGFALSDHGHRVGPTTIKDHRAGRCSCARA